MISIDAAGRGLLEVEQGIWSQNDPRMGGTLAWGSFLLTALKAQLCYIRNREYICKGGEIIIISDATGRLQEKSRWTAEIHQVLKGPRCCHSGKTIYPAGPMLPDGCWFSPYAGSASTCLTSQLAPACSIE